VPIAPGTAAFDRTVMLTEYRTLDYACAHPQGPDAQRHHLQAHAPSRPIRSGVEGRQFGRIIGSQTSWQKPACATPAASVDTRRPPDALFLV